MIDSRTRDCNLRQVMTVVGAGHEAGTPELFPPPSRHPAALGHAPFGRLPTNRLGAQMDPPNRASESPVGQTGPLSSDQDTAAFSPYPGNLPRPL